MHILCFRCSYFKFNCFQCITVDELKKLVKTHKDFPILKAANWQDAKCLLNEFLEINETTVSLKILDKFESKNMPLIYGLCKGIYKFCLLLSYFILIFLNI